MRNVRLLRAILIFLSMPILIQAQGLFVPSFWQQNFAIYFTTPLVNLTAGTCSSAQTLAVKYFSSQAAYTTPVTVLTSATAGLQLFSDIDCEMPITTLTTGASGTATYYLLASTPGSYSLTAYLDGFIPATETITYVTNNYVWTGNGGNTAWSTAANWSNNAVPGTTAIATFDGSCTANCSPDLTADINAAQAVKGIRFNSGYTGTLNQNGYDLYIGSAGLVIESGTLSGSANSAKVLTVTNGDIVINGGTFNAPAGMTTVHGAWRVLGSSTLTWPTGSTLDIECGSSGYTSCYNQTLSLYTGNTPTYYNVTFHGRKTSYDLSGQYMAVSGDLTMGDVLNQGLVIQNGNIFTSGRNIIQDNKGYRGYTNGFVTLVGNALGQTLSGSGGGPNYYYFPNMIINTGTNPITLQGTVGVVDYWKVLSSGTATTTNSTLSIEAFSSGYPESYQTSATIVPGNIVYNNVITRGYRTTLDLGAGTFNISGDYTFGDFNSAGRWLTNGTVLVSGNVTEDNWGNYGDANIIMRGSSTGVQLSAATFFPSVEIDTGSQPFTIVGSPRFWKWTYDSSGTFTNPSFELYCTSAMTYCYQQTVSEKMGSVAYNNLIIDGYRTTYDFGGNSVYISGDLTFGDQNSTGRNFQNGDIYLTGNATQTGWGNGSFNSTLRVKGKVAGSTLTGASINSWFPKISIESGANPITLAGSIKTEIYNYVNSGGVSASAGSILSITCSSSGSANCGSIGVSLSSGDNNANYNDLYIIGGKTVWDFGGSTWNVGGSLSLGDANSVRAINNTTFKVGKNLVVGSQGNNGNAVLQFTGTSNRTINQYSSNFPTGIVTFNNTGTTTFNTNVSFNSASQNIVVNTGLIDMNGKTWNIGGSLSVAAPATVTKNGGVINATGGIGGAGTINP